MKKEDKKNVQIRIKEKEPAIPIETYEYAERLVDPEGHDPALCPCPVPVRLTCIKKRLVIDLKDAYAATGGGAGEAYGVFQADPVNTLQLTTTVTDTDNSEPFTFSAICPADAPDSSKQGQETPCASSQGLHNSIRQIGTRNAQGFISQYIERGATFSVTFIHNDQGKTLRCFVMEDRTSSGNGQSVRADSGPVTAGHSVTIPGVTIADPSENLYFSATGPGTEWTVIITPTTGTARWVGDTNKLMSYGMNIFEDVPKAEYGRVTAMGMLGSYHGSDLQNGGDKTCAKVSQWFSLPDSNVYESIADLPNDVNEGPLKEGFHMHWVPSQLADLEPKGIADQRDHMFRYAFALKADDITQSFRIKITMHYEYFSTTSSYGSMTFPPPGLGTSVMLDYINTKIPCCTDNHDHRAKKMLDYVARKSKDGLKYVLQHPEALMEVAALAL